MDLDELISARENLLGEVVDYYSIDAAVLGMFLSGSLPAGTADAFSDIDLRLVVEAEEHGRFVASLLDTPKQWNGFLFNVAGADHSVSHFRPFFKIDIFYYSQANFAPSPWYTLPTTILYDPEGLLSEVFARSEPFVFEFNESRVDRVISKGLAAAHEVYRRARRGELLYAQKLLEDLRSYMAEADDCINQRVVTNPKDIKLDHRLSASLKRALTESYVPTSAVENALQLLLVIYRGQIIDIHKKFNLSRSLENDLYAISVIQED